MPPAAHGERQIAAAGKVERARDVGGGGTTNDQSGTFIEGAVEDEARGFVVGLPGGDYVAGNLRSQRADRSGIEASGSSRRCLRVSARGGECSRAERRPLDELSAREEGHRGQRRGRVGASIA